MTEKYLMRIAKVEISPLIFTDWLKGVDKPFTTNLPKDAQIFGVEWDYLRNVIVVLAASKEFDVVPEGFTPPKFDVICTVLEEKK
jgi:hypothetical protein